MWVRCVRGTWEGWWVGVVGDWMDGWDVWVEFDVKKHIISFTLQSNEINMFGAQRFVKY